ncbi:hypothetical protein AAY473_037693 [Plecturocebus cupreus]
MANVHLKPQLSSLHLFRTWRQENPLSLGGRGCSELRLSHCTPVWSREHDSEWSTQGCSHTHNCNQRRGFVDVSRDPRGV